MLDDENFPEPVRRDIDDFVGKPVPITREDRSMDSHAIGELAFELYKEAGKLIALALSTSGSPQREPLPRNQAICAGLLMRLAKFQLVVLQLTSGSARGEVVQALNRCILETAVNLRFLIRRDDDCFYHQFVLHSLGPERELFNLIESNIKARGGEKLPIEERMLESIERVCRMSGVTITDVQTRYGDWGGGLLERLRFLGCVEYYLFVLRLPSHAVHGSWVDLALHHLKEAASGFEVDETWSPVDSRLLLPVCQVMILPAVADFVLKFLPDCAERDYMLHRISDLTNRMRQADAIHEKCLR